MKSTNPELKTLQEAIKFFADPERTRQYFIARCWPDGVKCPRCGSDNIVWQAKYNRWQCNNRHERRQFTCKTGTIFEDSPLSLEKWMMAMWMICNCKNGVSSYEIHRAIGVTQKSAWFMLHRIRLAMHEGGMAFGGDGKEVEVDESFIGGKARNMHKSVKARRITGQGHNNIDKVIVMGVLERGDKGKSKVRTQVISDRRRETLHPIVKENVTAGTALYSDELWGYTGLEDEYDHQVIDHAIE